MSASRETVNERTCEKEQQQLDEALLQMNAAKGENKAIYKAATWQFHEAHARYVRCVGSPSDIYMSNSIYPK